MCLRAVIGSIGRSDIAESPVNMRVERQAPKRSANVIPPIPVLGSSSMSIDAEVRENPEPDRPTEVNSLDGPLTVRERRARAAALRALALSRTRRFGGARDAFIEASTLDPHLDLTRIPMFWSLERAAHEAAIDAYQLTGREAEAAVLRAQVRTTFRPKPLSAQTRTATIS
jgi:hypothetical protein